jgi:hypothetical protein
MTIVGSAMSPVQTAIGAKLEGDAPLMGLITGVFDRKGIPPGQAYPYITIGEGTETADDTFDTQGYADTTTLHIWSIQPGGQEAQQILGNLNRLLNGQPLTLDSLDHVGTWYDLAWTLDDPADTRLTHIVVRYRIEAGEQEER